MYIVLICLLIACAANAQPLFNGSEKRPADAIVLFDGKDLSGWNGGLDGKPGWKVDDGYMEVVPGTGDIYTKQSFGDCQLHIEFWLPLMADAKGQGRANSGVFLQALYEIQVLDSYGLKSGTGDCGAIYSIYPPMVNACRPPKQWQSYDVFFHAPKFDDKGNKISNARMSVLQNGVWIHEYAEVMNPTASPIGHDEKLPGPIVLQDHGCLVRYRNVWVRPL
jgi:hypothetical protein